MANALVGERAVGHYIFNHASREELFMFASPWSPAPNARLWTYAVLPGCRSRDAMAFYAKVGRYLALARLPAEDMVTSGASRFAVPTRVRSS